MIAMILFRVYFRIPAEILINTTLIALPVVLSDFIIITHAFPLRSY